MRLRNREGSARYYVCHQEGSVYHEGCISREGAQDDQRGEDRGNGCGYIPFPGIELPSIAARPRVQQPFH